ncbi:patatin-like phospholipase family protein [Bradyrhizobium sp. AUGA SZCCT0240]|jgi:NTE family protein|uniref:patatin-like phospholipase family protein n=1 Tax=unclassified Bradyrhizobium TaxID=2631580 RepID=UPI001BA9065A|nr:MULTISPECIES: patatin-like phospholipase family protein [unclassified Bradyrhizobium]MBR1239139.1 patatin-like phospholipase family protein [Bradyrhizobium sp. AUGA SZCCT0274]MBR1245949.1 patatin-like phospholipase family protein [Bradyrhizobium sp. AUGA SZCCT0169]MBR1255428.1 patatin-like phospholipase family protein [Bradyrhizobium sp. AUGA SZCCT0240]
MPDAPVVAIPTDPEVAQLEPTMALCLSGGGYRAMVFHIGVLWRLYETGLLRDIKRISSVSGGSITAGVLALKWRELSFKPNSVKTDFIPKFVAPLRAFAGVTIDAESVILGALLPGSIGDRIARAYDEHLFHGKTLQDMPDEPRFVINATNVQSGVLWRFMKPYMRDYRVGKVSKPKVPLAHAVAASSAFPPVLSPFELRLKESDFDKKSGLDLQRPPFTTRVVLSDGGVYDNLGLETAWKRHQTVFVSDAGGKIEAEEEPETDWPRHSYRVLNLIDSQVRSLRKRQVIESYKSGERNGAYWGIRTNIADYKLADALPCPHERTLQLAEIPTRLKRMDDETQERLINWGYAVCDAAIRKHVAAKQPKAEFPYPQSPI